MMQQSHERWRRLAQRERTMLLIGGIVAGASVVFALVIDPLLAAMDRLDRQAAKKQKESVELAVLGQEHAAKRARLAKAESRMPVTDSRFSLVTFLEEAAQSANVRERITGMQPQVQTLAQGFQETAVDLRLDGVQLPDLLALLVVIDQAPYDVQVRHLQIRPKFDDPVNLDATIRVLSYAKDR